MIYVICWIRCYVKKSIETARLVGLVQWLGHTNRLTHAPHRYLNNCKPMNKRAHLQIGEEVMPWWIKVQFPFNDWRCQLVSKDIERWLTNPSLQRHWMLLLIISRVFKQVLPRVILSFLLVFINSYNSVYVENCV